MTSGPLEGVVILDFTQLLQGPYATMMLGDMGAEIIKVEPPKGDWMRKFSSANLYVAGESVSFMTFNRNKRSLAIDLKQPAGIEVIKRLAERADVVIENFRPGVMERLGIGYDALRAINPRLIYCASSGWGHSGPYVSRPGQDLLVQSMSGLPYLNGKESDPPIPVGPGIADISASLHIIYGVLAELFRRERTGVGARVNVNLFNALMTIVAQDFATYLNGGGLPPRSKSGINPTPYNGAPYGVYPTQDGYIAIAMTPVNQLARLLGLSGYEHIDSNNVTDDRDAINLAFAEVFKTRTTSAWLDLLLPEDIWCAPVHTFAEVESDPQLAHNEMIISFDHPTAGRVRAIGMPVKFEGIAEVVRRPPPLLDQHSDELLAEFGGYSADEIAALRAQGVIGART